MRATAWQWSNRVNLALDAAGRYRRLAITLIAMSAGLLILALDATITVEDSKVDALLYAAVAGAMLWLAADLYRFATLIDRTARPHRSVATVVCASMALAAAKAEGMLGLWNHRPSLVIGGAMLAAALLASAGADRTSPKAAAPLPRTLLVLGGLLFGVAVLVEVIVNGRGFPLYPAGLGIVGIAALLLAFFEARLLARMVTYAIR